MHRPPESSARSCLGLTHIPDQPMPTWLPPLPQSLAHVHDPALVAELDARVQGLMAMPVHLEPTAAGQRLHVMGGFVYERDAQGLIHSARWVLDAAGHEVLEPCKAHTVVAEGGPFESRWTLPLAQGLRWVLNQRHPAHALDVRLYTDTLLAAMVDRYWTPEAAARVRATVQQHLQLDPVVMGHVRCLQAAGLGRGPRMADYNRALVRAQEDARLMLEAPQLLTLYALIEVDLPLEGARAAAMKTYLQDQGVRPATWRLLHQHGTQWMQAFMGYFDEDTSGPQRAINLVHLLQLFGFQQQLNLDLMHSLMRLRENPNSPVRSAEMWDEHSTLGRLLRRLGVLAEQGSAADRERMCEKLYHLVHWVDQHRPDGAWLARCTVSGLLRRVWSDQQLAQATLAHGQRWHLPVQIAWPDPTHTLVFLSTALDIWKEGQAMQHCAANYIDVCATGQEIMASVRPRAGGKAVATLSFSLGDEVVQVARLSGFANSKVSTQVAAMAQQVAADLTERWQHQALWQAWQQTL